VLYMRAFRRDSSPGPPWRAICLRPSALSRQRRTHSWKALMYEGFRKFEIQTSDPEVKIVGRVGGSGPAVLLLHGNPLTHVHWHLVAPRLARNFTVVATDLRGYGDSGKPRGKEDHSNYSFRRMAQDQVDVMAALGFTKFMVAGHDRGARAAFRMALDHPE